MPHYYFNVHDNGPAQWDDVGHEYNWRNDIEAHAVRLIVAARIRQKVRRDIGVTTSVLVHYDDGGLALTVIARPGRDMQFIWAGD